MHEMRNNQKILVSSLILLGTRRNVNKKSNKLINDSTVRKPKLLAKNMLILKLLVFSKASLNLIVLLFFVLY